MIGRMRVKICGVTRLEDAELAIRLGADALGFVFWPGSPRLVDMERARGIARALPALAARVGVFVNMSPPEVASFVDRVGLDVVQLHGDERIADYEHLGARVIKAVSLGNDTAASAALHLPAAVTLLVDADDRGRRGGTGQQADWSRAAELARARPILLAGGLTADNVADAVKQVKPWAVDVSSGVEEAPGRKSAEKLRAFFESLASVSLEER